MTTFPPTTIELTLICDTMKAVALLCSCDVVDVVNLIVTRRLTNEVKGDLKFVGSIGVSTRRSFQLEMKINTHSLLVPFGM